MTKHVALLTWCLNYLALTPPETALLREILHHTTLGTLPILGASMLSRKAEVEALFRKCREEGLRAQAA